jgi:16S rRNA (cytosine967-C5)-methyltransferase
MWPSTQPCKKQWRSFECTQKSKFRKCIGISGLGYLENSVRSPYCRHVYQHNTTHSKPQIKFVNAILRNVDRRGRAELEKNTTIYDNIEPWLAEEWIRTYGEDTTKTIIEASMGQSPIYVSVNHAPESTDNDRTAKLERVKDYFSTSNNTAILLPHGSIEIPKELHGGSVSKWPFYNEGEWWVQDPSASLPAIALHNALCKDKKQEKKDMHIVDLCSAPGGKTAQLCSLGYGKVTAIEVSKRRTKALHDNMDRLGMNDVCNIVVADGREWVPSVGSGNDSVKGVLADVPCSATGVGSRRPDVLRKSPDILDQLLTIQRELAAHAADEILEPGGIMVYATCSLLKQESEDQVNWLLSRSEGADMETVPIIPGEIPGFDDAIDENGWLRVIPGVLPGSLASCDGFFVARLRRLR